VRPLLEVFLLVDFLTGVFLRDVVFALPVVFRVVFDVFFAIFISA
jgi:hypothetical protein